MSTPDLLPCLLELLRGTAADAPLAVATHAILDTSGLLGHLDGTPACLVVPWCERLSCICAPRDSWMPGGRRRGGGRVRLGKAMVRCREGRRGGGLDGRPGLKRANS
ncbi:hypothetical protein EDB84DRAFT_1436190 [Lactarius hengduanensis]|nr:hypothetical protein EDB84DRAFT_1436190 [Lactarius hengduanensis]